MSDIAWREEVRAKMTKERRNEENGRGKGKGSNLGFI